MKWLVEFKGPTMRWEVPFSAQDRESALKEAIRFIVSRRKGVSPTRTFGPCAITRMWSQDDLD